MHALLVTPSSPERHRILLFSQGRFEQRVYRLSVPLTSVEAEPIGMAVLRLFAILTFLETAKESFCCTILDFRISDWRISGNFRIPRILSSCQDFALSAKSCVFSEGEESMQPRRPCRRCGGAPIAASRFSCFRLPGHGRAPGSPW